MFPAQAGLVVCSECSQSEPDSPASYSRKQETDQKFKLEGERILLTLGVDLHTVWDSFTAWCRRNLFQSWVPYRTTRWFVFSRTITEASMARAVLNQRLASCQFPVRLAECQRIELEVRKHWAKTTDAPFQDIFPPPPISLTIQSNKHHLVQQQPRSTQRPSRCCINE
jgi:hypothetical protein